MLEGDTSGERIVDAEHGLLLKLRLVESTNGVDLLAALPEAFQGVQEDEEEGIFFDDLSVFAIELAIALEPRQTIGKVWRALLIEKSAELLLRDDTIWLRRSG